MGTIAKVTAGGSTHLIASTAYATCTTEASTTAKVATIQDSQAFSLFNGETIHVYFRYTNTATTPTLNVNSTGAKPIRLFGSVVPTDAEGSFGTSWREQSLVSFTYNTTLVANGCWLMNDTGSARDTLVLNYGDNYQAVHYAIDNAIANNRNIVVKKDNNFYQLYNIQGTSSEPVYVFTCITNEDHGESNIGLDFISYEATTGWDNEFQATLLTKWYQKEIIILTISGTSVTTTKTLSDAIWAYTSSSDVLFRGTDGLDYNVISYNNTTRTLVLYAVDNTNSQIKVITLSSSGALVNMSGTLSTIPIGGSGGGGYVLEYGAQVVVQDVLDAISNDCVLMCFIDNDPDWDYAYYQGYNSDNSSFDYMTFVRTKSTSTGSTIYTYKWDSTQTSTNNGWSYTESFVPSLYPYLQAYGEFQPSVSLPQDSLVQVTLTSTNQIRFGTGLSVVSGGIQVSQSGIYKVSGDVWIRSATTGTTFTRSAEIRKGTDFNNSSTIQKVQYSGEQYTTENTPIIPKLVSLNANDIVFLCARSLDGDGVFFPAPTGNYTYLLVEQVASQGDYGIEQTINYLPNADITEY